ncbi:ferritin heavy chain-like [Orycteropus afer afer]|uniref:Ferritin n=1 Tax=Orycteropus afer afer TaxID=1230840 RepID=A0A8B7BCJ6_ORYAF|nr:ferritin heavy chain-like [Orycteropus afer afer]
MTRAPSQVHQNYQRECEAAINWQIHFELYAASVYFSMAYHFDREDVGLKNFANYFLGRWREKHEHTEKLLALQNQRGGHIHLGDISRPAADEWGSGLNAMKFAFHLERTLNQSLLSLYWLAYSQDDMQLCGLLESRFLHKQVRTIKELGGHVSNLSSQEDAGLAEYRFHKLSLGDSDSDKEN